MIPKEQVYEALLECYDPEIPVNIVDLGLIYDVEVDGEKVAVKMTLTAPGCGMGTMIAADAKEKIMALDGITDATVDLVWDPPWNPSMIKDEAKQRLGISDAKGSKRASPVVNSPLALNLAWTIPPSSA